jgi:molybdate transport system substrate-binding protein
MLRIAIIVAGLFIAGLEACPAHADKATIAVAANFAGTLQKLQQQFESASPHKLTLISGSTGKLAAQIAEGAPFDVFLSADDKTTKKLGAAAIAESEYTYATGTLVLFSADRQRLSEDSGDAVLAAGDFSKLAIANPKLAPYGVAAEETLRSLGVFDAVKNKIVMGENIAQTFQLIQTHNAELGFVALSQAMEAGAEGSRWIVPAKLHAPIRQNVVLLTRAKDNPAARNFWEFLRSPEAVKIIETAGYSQSD